MSRGHALRSLASAVRERFPDVLDPMMDIASGRVTVNGLVVTNPRTLVRADARIGWNVPVRLRGEPKLRAALAQFDVEVTGRVALDLGAAAGGFTRVLLEHGARRIYAVDAGFGQLLGSLRQDERVVNLERTNLAALDTDSISEQVDVITVDLSYLRVSTALEQLGRIRLAADADLVALVKPMFELGLERPPRGPVELRRAVAIASRGAQRAGWRILGSMRSPVTGAGGAVEFLLHGRRAPR